MFTRQTPYPNCRHTRTNGLRCKSPAKDTSAFCHFHQKQRRTRPSTIGPEPALSRHVLHPLGDFQSIQQALGMVMSALWSGQLSTKKAGPMLYALQLASTELRKTRMQ
jgi:hypothetical protein